ncbi:MAG: DUF2141 domain-containing protein [Cytophagales bacterium]|nr:DUF2141 domain-containing protein [Bernardetiaceae bacterium]MDW8210911.1 DUF2141 domain-containing protein [Cytophagales bacterium]
MKYVSSVLAVLILFACSLTAVAQKGKIIVEIGNLRNNSGKVLAALYNSEKTFMSERQAVATGQATITSQTAQIVFEVPYGEYAIALLHDENDNGKMDSNLFGIPKEGYAVSNNAKNSFGAPKYVDAKFRLDKPEVRQKIEIIYW